jgi:hypothetical protein
MLNIIDQVMMRFQVLQANNRKQFSITSLLTAKVIRSLTSQSNEKSY